MATRLVHPIRSSGRRGRRGPVSDAIVHPTRPFASVRCSPWRGPHSARRLHSATTLPRAQDDDATSQDTGNAACRIHTPPEPKCISTRSGASSSSYSDTASCPAGHTAALLAVTSMSKSAAVSLTSPSFSSVSPGPRPPTGLTLVACRRDHGRPEPVLDSPVAQVPLS